jgi:AraC family transcriptional regulator
MTRQETFCLNDADTANRYLARFRRVLAHVETHLDEVLDVERLSNVAAYSKWHFQRQFVELFGLGVCEYVQISRLKRAAQQLAYRDLPIMEIALTSRYEGPEAFARAFRKRTGMSPSDFRKAPDWDAWHELIQPLKELRSQYMQSPHTADDVRIVDFAAAHVAAIEHRGDPRRIGDTIRRFIEWRKENDLSPRISATFNIAYDDPEQVPADDFRFDICAATDREIAPNAAGVIAKTIPGGRCAVLRHVGSEDTLPQSIRYLYASWLPSSGEEPRDFPLFMQRVKFFPDVSEHEAVTDIFLPLK